MKAYGETIADTVRRREILDAKIYIHDEMNRMLLATQKAAKSEDSEERAEILRMWSGRTRLLRREPKSGAGGSVVSDLNALAAVIGININWEGYPDTGDRETLRLFIMAAREAMANAAKHAGAENITISVKDEENALTAVFTNDGEPPDETVRETGGLKNLRRGIESCGGSMEIVSRPVFRLKVVIPKGGGRNAL